MIHTPIVLNFSPFEEGLSIPFLDSPLFYEQNVLREFCDPVLWTGWNWRVRRQVRDEGIQVDHAGQQVSARKESSESVSAAGQEIVDRDAVAGNEIDRSTVDLDIADLAPDGRQ